LFYAIELKTSEFTKFLIENGADIYQKDL